MMITGILVAGRGDGHTTGLHELHHDPRHQVGRPTSSAEGLAEGSVGLLGGTVLGISSVAPAYALTATIGLSSPRPG